MSKPPMSQWSTCLEPDLEGNHVLQSLDIDVLHPSLDVLPEPRNLEPLAPQEVASDRSLPRRVKLGLL